MFLDETKLSALRSNENTIIDDYFIDHNTRNSEEENLFEALNQLIAQRYTETGIFEGNYEQNLEWLIDDFRSRSDYFTYGIFERTKDWEWINPLGTISFFMDENNLPAFDQMPAESIDVLYKTIENDIDALDSEYEIFKTPGIVEFGRLAIGGKNGLKVKDYIAGALLQFSENILVWPKRPKTHYMVCCNTNHSRTYEKAFQTIPLEESKASVYNGKVGIFMYNSFLNLHQRHKGQRMQRAAMHRPDVYVWY